MKKAAVELASRADIDALVALEHTSFDSDRLSRPQLLRFIAKQQLFVLREQSLLVGYAVLLMRKNSHKARLYSLAVAPQLRGQGWGAWFLQALCAQVQSRYQAMTLEVDPTNTAAVKVYQHVGFVYVKTLPSYYENGNSAWQMIKRWSCADARATHHTQTPQAPPKQRQKSPSDLG